MLKNTKFQKHSNAFLCGLLIIGLHWFAWCDAGRTRAVGHRPWLSSWRCCGGAELASMRTPLAIDGASAGKSLSGQVGGRLLWLFENRCTVLRGLYADGPGWGLLPDDTKSVSGAAMYTVLGAPYPLGALGAPGKFASPGPSRRTAAIPQGPSGPGRSAPPGLQGPP